MAGLSLPGDGLTLVDGGGGGGGGTTTGTFTTAANPVIPFPAGHTKFVFQLTVTSNAVQADGQGLDFQTSANPDGSSPDTGNHYLAIVSGNTATSPNNIWFWAHWSGPSGGALEINLTLTLDIGAADRPFTAFGVCQGRQADDTLSLLNLYWAKDAPGAVAALRGIMDNSVPGTTFTGNWSLTALD